MKLPTVTVTGHPDYPDQVVVINKSDFDPKKGMKIYDAAKAEAEALEAKTEAAKTAKEKLDAELKAKAGK